jgi:hypothetical protein
MQFVRWLAVALGALLAGAITYSAIAMISRAIAWSGAPSSPAMEACLIFQAALFGSGVSVYTVYQVAPQHREIATNLMGSAVTLLAVVLAVQAALDGAFMDVPRSIGAMLGVLLALHVKGMQEAA